MDRDQSWSHPLDRQQAAKLYRMGVKRGWPDHLIIWPLNIVGIEWKKPGEGRLSVSRVVRTRSGKPRWVQGQRETFPKLRAAGMKIYECGTVDHALRILRASECPMRRWEAT